MQSKITQVTDTKIKLTIVADAHELNAVKATVLKQLSANVKLAGFREGKAPLSVVEKNVDPKVLENEFIQMAIQGMYTKAVDEHKIRLAGHPQVNITKFVPYSTLEFDAEVEVVGDVKLPDYKKIKLVKKQTKVTDADVDTVMESLQKRLAEKVVVKRAAKDGDEVVIDFKGTDTKGEAVNGADGKDYPLQLGSKTFIPGFEENLVGLKEGDNKKFTLTFPKDYGVKAIANKKVTFEVDIKSVNEMTLPKVDDEFAAKVGPFKSAADLKKDIREQLQLEKGNEDERNFESELVKEVTSKSKVALPESLVEEQSERIINEIKQNLMYRGQTWQEYLEVQGKTEDQYKKEDIRQEAEDRVKAGLVLSQISVEENLDVTADELNDRIDQLKMQYKDAAMQAELDKPENRQDIASRILTEKTVAKLKSYIAK